MNQASATQKDFASNRTSRALYRLVLMFIFAGSLLAPAASRAGDLKEQTLKSWDEYVAGANAQAGSRPQGPFLWVDEDQDRLQRVRAGEILVSPVGRQDPKPVPSGLIHDWLGAAFIPNAKLEDVLSAVRDYGNYKDYYKPTVVDSTSLRADGSCDEYSMRVVNKAVVAETALDMQYETCYFQTGKRQWYSVTHTTRVQEIRHYGKPNQQELPPNQGSGYIWRLYSVGRFEQRDGGVYVELEAIALSRDIPFAFRWLVNPIVRRVSMNSMVLSLQQTKEAVRSTEAKHGSLPGKDGNYLSRNGAAQ